MCESDRYLDILSAVQIDESALAHSQVGWCRKWTREAVIPMRRFCDENGIDAIIHAMEVDIEPGVQHTFIKMTIPGCRPFLFDGVGTASHDPYFGYEDEAPEHLQNSRFDMINSINENFDKSSNSIFV